MSILGPPQDGQHAHRSENRSEAPEVCSTGNRVATGAFRAEHRDRSCNDAGQAHDDMREDDGQEHGGPGWDRDPEDYDAVVRHDALRRLTLKVTGAPRCPSPKIKA